MEVYISFVEEIKLSEGQHLYTDRFLKSIVETKSYSNYHKVILQAIGCTCSQKQH